MEVMIPVWLDDAKTRAATQPLSELTGARIALVDDNYDEPFTSHLEHLLRDRHGVIVDRLVKPLGSAPSPSTLIDQAAKSQVAIVGIAL